jgi:RNA polymerase sigma-70 factor (ECF subfamily)
MADSRLVQWFREWRTPLRRFLASHRAVAPADVDDVAQEVFLRMLRYDRVELVVNPQRYLFKMAANVAAEWSMRSSRRRPHASAWLLDLATESGPESNLESQADEANLRRALESLPPRSREVLRLHFAESLNHEEIAQRLRVSRRVVKREMIRAYAMLRIELRADPVECSSSRRNVS